MLVLSLEVRQARQVQRFRCGLSQSAAYRQHGLSESEDRPLDLGWSQAGLPIGQAPVEVPDEAVPVQTLSQAADPPQTASGR